MTQYQQNLIIKLLIGVLIFALLISIKTIIINNLENLGFSEITSLNIYSIWTNYYLDFFYAIIAIVISAIISYNFNIKGE